MPTICPKCNYARKESDACPTWQCPSCQVAYNKVSDTQYSPREIGATSAPSQAAHHPQVEKSSGAWKWFLIVAIVVGVAWQGKFFSKRPATSANTEQFAQSDGQPSIILYSATWCGYCRAARDFFNQKGLAYTEHDMETSPEGVAGYEKLGGGGIPLMLVGGEKIRGFSQAQLEERLGPWMKK